MDQILDKVRQGGELTPEERTTFFEHYRAVTGTNTQYNGCAAQIVNCVKELDSPERMPAVEPVTPKTLPASTKK